MNDINEEFEKLFQDDDSEDDTEDIAASSENAENETEDENNDTIGFEIFELSGSIDNVFDDKLLDNQEEEVANAYLAALKKAKRYTVNRTISEEEKKSNQCGKRKHP